LRACEASSYQPETLSFETRVHPGGDCFLAFGASQWHPSGWAGCPLAPTILYNYKLWLICSLRHRMLCSTRFQKIVVDFGLFKAENMDSVVESGL
jgi:hypothetical protein